MSPRRSGHKYLNCADIGAVYSVLDFFERREYLFLFQLSQRCNIFLGESVVVTVCQADVP